MALRLMKCVYCSHSLRFGAHICGKCHQDTPSINRIWRISAGVCLAAVMTVLAVGVAVS